VPGEKILAGPAEPIPELVYPLRNESSNLFFCGVMVGLKLSLHFFIENHPRFCPCL
jgi:hypothetical protein